jgi:hypothetical protein
VTYGPNITGANNYDEKLPDHSIPKGEEPTCDMLFIDGVLLADKATDLKLVLNADGSFNLKKYKDLLCQRLLPGLIYANNTNPQGTIVTVPTLGGDAFAGDKYKKIVNENYPSMLRAIIEENIDLLPNIKGIVHTVDLLRNKPDDRPIDSIDFNFPVPYIQTYRSIGFCPTLSLDEISKDNKIQGEAENKLAALKQYKTTAVIAGDRLSPPGCDAYLGSGKTYEGAAGVYTNVIARVMNTLYKWGLVGGRFKVSPATHNDKGQDYSTFEREWKAKDFKLSVRNVISVDDPYMKNNKYQQAQHARSIRECATAFAMSQSKNEATKNIGNQYLDKFSPETVEQYRREDPVIFYAQSCLTKLQSLVVERHKDDKAQIETRLIEFINQPNVSLKDLRSFLRLSYYNIQEEGIINKLKGKSRLARFLNEFLAKELPKDEVINIMETKRRDAESGFPWLQLSNEKYIYPVEKLNNQTRDMINTYQCIDLNLIIDFFDTKKFDDIPLVELYGNTYIGFRPLKEALLKFLYDYNKNDKSELLKYSAETLAVLGILKDNVPNKMDGYEIKNKLNQLYYQVLDLQGQQLYTHEDYKVFLNRLNSVKNNVNAQIKINAKNIKEYNDKEIDINTNNVSNDVNENEDDLFDSIPDKANKLTRKQTVNYEKNKTEARIRDILSNDEKLVEAMNDSKMLRSKINEDKIMKNPILSLFEIKNYLNFPINDSGTLYALDPRAEVELHQLGISDKQIKKLTQYQLAKYASVVHFSHDKANYLPNHLFRPTEDEEFVHTMAQNKSLAELQTDVLGPIIKEMVANDILLNEIKVEEIVTNILKLDTNITDISKNDISKNKNKLSVDKIKKFLTNTGFDKNIINYLTPDQIVKYYNAILQSRKEIQKTRTLLLSKLDTDYAAPFYANAVSMLKDDQSFEKEVLRLIVESVQQLMANEINEDQKKIKQILSNELKIEATITKQLINLSNIYTENESKERKFLLDYGVDKSLISNFIPAQIHEYYAAIKNSEQKLEKMFTNLLKKNTLATKYSDPSYAGALYKIKEGKFNQIIKPAILEPIQQAMTSDIVKQEEIKKAIVDKINVKDVININLADKQALNNTDQPKNNIQDDAKEFLINYGFYRDNINNLTQDQILKYRSVVEASESELNKILSKLLQGDELGKFHLDPHYAIALLNITPETCEKEIKLAIKETVEKIMRVDITQNKELNKQKKELNKQKRESDKQKEDLKTLDASETSEAKHMPPSVYENSSVMFPRVSKTEVKPVQIASESHDNKTNKDEVKKDEQTPTYTPDNKL